MPNNFVNTITTSNGTTYDVQDKRLTVTAADAGKVVSVDSNGNLSLTTPSDGTKLYRHAVSGSCKNYSNESISINLVIFTDIGTPLTDFSDAYNHFIQVYGFLYNNNTYTQYFVLRITGNSQVVTLQSSNSTLVTIEIKNINLSNDTVTEL